MSHTHKNPSFFQKLGSGPKVVIPNGSYFEDFKGLADERTLITYDPRKSPLIRSVR
jgi:hypothetical protein